MVIFRNNYAMLDPAAHKAACCFGHLPGCFSRCNDIQLSAGKCFSLQRLLYRLIRQNHLYRLRNDPIRIFS